MRKRLYEIIEISQDNDTASRIYDILMMCAIIISIIPLAFKESNPYFSIIDITTTILFVSDYLLRWLTSDYKSGTKGIISFIRYPFTIWAIVDLLSILPGLSSVSNSFKLFKLFRLFRTLRTIRVFKIFKAFRYSQSISIIIRVIKNSKDALVSVSMFAIGYIVISALVIFNVEGDAFETFFDAIYWATVSLTTIGYGDIYPVTTAGRIITMISSLFGIAIVALPAGIITAGYIDFLSEEKKKT